MSEPPLVEDVADLITRIDQALLWSTYKLPANERLGVLVQQLEKMYVHAYRIYLSLGGLDHQKEEGARE